MQAMVCELCGSNDIVKQNGLYVCQHCGTKYTVEEAKKLLGTVKIDRSEELSNLYTVARRAKDENNAELAVKYYEQILAMDPTSWEASFYVVYFRATQCKIAQIQSAAISVSNCLNSTLNLIKTHVIPQQSQIQAVSEVCSRVISLSYLLFTAATNHYGSIDIDIRHKFGSEYTSNCDVSRDLDYNLGDVIDSTFGGDAFKPLAIQAWKAGLDLHKHNELFDRDKLEVYRKKVGVTFIQSNTGKTATEWLDVAAAKMAENSIDDAQGIFLELEKDAELKPIALLGKGVYNAITTNNKTSSVAAINQLHSAENAFNDNLKGKYKNQIKSIVCAHSNEGYTALMIVASKLDVALLRFLLSLGAEVNAKNRNNETALWLITNGSRENVDAMVEATKVLLDAGADTNVASLRNGYQLLNGFTPAPVKKLILSKNPSTDFGIKGKSGGCYVATAVYGSYDCPQVWTLRRLRDYTLAETWYGRAFIRTYYAISPTLVKWFGDTEWFKNMWKPMLDKMVYNLNHKGVDNTPYNDKNW